MCKSKPLPLINSAVPIIHHTTFCVPPAIMAALYRKAEGLVDSAEAIAYGFHESAMEKKTRKQCGFHQTESLLPNIKKLPASDHRPSLGSDILSHLGTWNPLPKDITDNDTVWLLDNTAHRSSVTNKWEAEFVAAVFDKDTGLEVSTVVADIAEKLGFGKGDAAEATIRDRLMPFMQSILPGRKVNVILENTTVTLGPGGRNAISADVKPVPSHNDGKIVSSTANVPKGANGILTMRTAYAEPEGWAVISGLLSRNISYFAYLYSQISMILSRSRKPMIRLVS
jgi:hypothetical protein